MGSPRLIVHIVECLESKLRLGRSLPLSIFDHCMSRSESTLRQSAQHGLRRSAIGGAFYTCIEPQCELRSVKHRSEVLPGHQSSNVRCSISKGFKQDISCKNERVSLHFNFTGPAAITLHTSRQGSHDFHSRTPSTLGSRSQETFQHGAVQMSTQSNQRRYTTLSSMKWAWGIILLPTALGMELKAVYKSDLRNQPVADAARGASGA
eukprot:3720262-Amphidinium_carterae.2